MQYGICNLSLVPVRTEPSDKSELCTQLLFGDVFRVLQISENEKWIEIQIAFDQYQGWIDAKQYKQVSEAYYTAHLMQSHQVCFEDVAPVESSAAQHLILLGSSIPFLSGRKFQIGQEQYTFDGELFQIPSVLTTDFVKMVCLRYMHTPYLWGGKSLFGIDCSGFVQQVFKILGYQLQRDAYQQAVQGQRISNFEDLSTGDLAFFVNDNGRVIHVGIILEQNLIIHAHAKVRIDKLDEVGIYNVETKTYSHKLGHFTRILVI